MYWNGKGEVVACLELLSRNSPQGISAGTCYRNDVSFPRASPLRGFVFVKMRHYEETDAHTNGKTKEVGTKQHRRNDCNQDTVLRERWASRPAVSGTTWGRLLLKKPTVAQLVVSFSAFNGTRRFITVITRSRHRCLS